MWTISKTFSFSASHRLYGLPENHPCSKLHGHNYEVTLFFASDSLTGECFVVDYRQLEPIKKWMDVTLDHQHLNDIFPFSTTVENMSQFIFEMWKDSFPTLIAVEMSETPKTRCRYEPKS